MTDKMPDKIFVIPIFVTTDPNAFVRHGKFNVQPQSEGDTEYTRTSLVDELKAENERLNAKISIIDQVANSSHECECEKSGMLTIMELTEGIPTIHDKGKT